MNNIRVLMFGWELPPENSGGLGVACLGLSRKLNENGVDIKFVVPRKKESMRRSCFKLLSASVNYNFEEIEFESPMTPYITAEKYESVLKREESDIYGENLFEEVARYRECAKKLAKYEKFDVIHAHDWLSFGAGVEAKKITEKPLVAHVHATEFDRGGGVNIDERVYKREREGMEAADKVIAVSHYTKGIVVEKYGIPEDKVEVAHNGVDLSEKPVGKELLESLKKAGKKIVLFVGRITLQKGPDYFLEAAREVINCSDDIIFVVAGSGDMDRQIMRQAAELGITDRVLFPGFIRGDELHGLYKAADLFVMPSVSEPFGLTPLESLVNGTPVLVSKQSGVSEVLTHALKVDFWDTRDMANKILTFLNHRPLVDCLTEKGRQEVDQITWDPAANKCLEIYKSLTN